MNRIRSRLVTALVTLGLVTGCQAGTPAGDGGPDAGEPDGQPPSSDGGDGGDGDEDGEDEQDLPPVEDATALLEVYALDIWAQGLPSAGTSLRVTRDEVDVETTGWPVAALALHDAATYEVALSAEGHEPLTVSVTFDGSEALDAVAVRAGAEASGQGVSVSHDVREIEGRSIPVHSVYLGLRHRWFSAGGRPARRGNRLELMTSGEEAWGRVAEDIEAATDHIHVATWWWESDFELLRDEATHVTSTEAEREQNTILAMLDRSPADKRVLINHLPLDLTTDSDVRARGAAAGDRFEVMRQANETRGRFYFEVRDFLFRDHLLAERPEVEGRAFETEEPVVSRVPPHMVDLTDWPVELDIEHASYHQKFAIVDGEVAFVGGMNLRRVDWDTDEHRVFEPRRMLIGSSRSAREAVEAHEALPDTGPRKDYMVRIEGPLVQDAEDIFHERWVERLEAGEEYSENATPFEVDRDQESIPDGVQAQLTASLPEPFREHAIAETWFNAVANAEEYILIEDQYFRVPMLVDAIVDRMTTSPSLQLIVITKAINESTDPGCQWTYTTDQELRTLFPTRYFTYTLRSFDVQITWGIDETEARFQDIDIHSKLLVVDDVFLSVGSANKNNRGLVYEGELNVAVFDRDWVTTARRRILSLILPAGTTISDESGGPDGWVVQLAEAAAWNDYVYESWHIEGWDISVDGAPLPREYTPAGFLYTLELRDPVYCLIEGIGPDMT